MLAKIEALLAIGKQLRGQNEDIAGEALPRRWIDLIHHLNEQDSQRRPQRRSRVIGGKERTETVLQTECTDVEHLLG